MNGNDALLSLASYARTAEATAEGVAELANLLDDRQWEMLLRQTDVFAPLPDDGRYALSLGDGDDTWSVLWWDADGCRVVAHVDHNEDGDPWYAQPDPKP